VFLLLAAVGPAALVGIGLMLYNDLRFGSPFEFGWRYQLTDVRNTTAQQFSLQYLWPNLWFYFCQPVAWGGHFPFLQAARSAHMPLSYYGVAEPYCGVLVNAPIVWFALAMPLAWRGAAAGEKLAVRWFILAALLLFAICVLTLCLFFCGSCSYEIDFLPALMLVVVVSVMALERALAGAPAWRWIARGGWFVLLAYSIAFNLLAGVKVEASANHVIGNSFFHQGNIDEAIVHQEKAVALDPESAAYRNGLGVAYASKGRLNEAIAQFQKAVEIQPAYVDAQYSYGMTLIQAGRLDEALVHFQKALKINPHAADAYDAAPNNNMAWSLATSPEASHRNGPIAVMLAEAACRKTQYQQTVMVGTLSAAYAEAGRFEEAISTSRKAITLAKKNGEANLLTNNEKLLDLYLKHQPYRESPAASPQ
jgi:Flp pilus assembly protein TadD